MAYGTSDYMELISLHSLHLSALLNVSVSVISSTLHRFLRAGIVRLTFVLLMFLFCLFYFNFYFSRATVSAVLQPCRTCHMLFVLLARCVVCVLGK